jgi:hypothetical protein
MERYFVFGVFASVIIISVIIFLFGVGTNGSVNINHNQKYYSAVNSSLQQSIYSDILNLQTSQIAIPTGKSVVYSTNYTISTSNSILSGAGTNSSETGRGMITLIKSANGNSESETNFTVSMPFYGVAYNITSISYIFTIGNNSHLCTDSTATGGKIFCTSLNESIGSLSNMLSSGLKLSRLSILRAYNTTYRGYPCFFTESSFSISLNENKSALIGANSGNESIAGTATSCVSKEYNIQVMNSLSANISVNINNSAVKASSLIDYNMSILRMTDFNTEITNSSLPN